MADNTNKPIKPLRGFPTSPDKTKVIPAIPERIFNQVTPRETRLVGPNVGPQYISGWVDLVRYRDTPDGPELDPTGEPIRLDIPDLEGMAARMPEAATLLNAFEAFWKALAQEQRAI